MTKFRTIVADPPWKYIDEGLWQRQSSQANKQYSTLTIDDICKLPVPVEDNAYLWLWITNRHLVHGIGKTVAEAWGFRPLTIMTWCKTHFGLGYYIRNASEHIVFGVRGSPGPLKRKNQTSWFVEPRQSHSTKPDRFYSIVESLCDGPYLELFARQPRNNWTVWGNEIHHDPLGIGFDPEKW